MGRAMLFTVSALVIIAGLTISTNNKRVESLPTRISDSFYEQQAKNIATSLVDNAIQNLLLDMDWLGSIPADNNYRGSGTLQTYTQNSAGLDTLDHSVVQWDEYKALLISRATYEDYTAEIEVLMQRDSFSKFSYFTDNEPLIYFTTGDVINGPVHTNGTFNMQGSPEFNGFVSSPNEWEAHPGGASPVFNGGTNFELPGGRDLPEQAQIDLLRTNSDLTFTGAKEVTFFVNSNDGYVRVAEPGCLSVTCFNDYRLADYNAGEVIISVDGDVKVKGTLKGKVSLHSTDDIDIVSDVYYNTNPLVDSTSTDLLGLIAQDEVRVDRWAHSQNGSSDLTIHASIMAMDKFVVEDYQYGSFRGDLNVVGGIVQRERGAVGTFGGYSGTTGYSKNYIYDERLLQEIPPSFPRESIFTIVYWKERVLEGT